MTQVKEIPQNEIQVRPLNTKDFWNILNIVRAGGKAAFQKLREADQDSEMGAAMVILDIGMEFAQKELSVFLAGVANMTVEEYNNSDFDTTLEILEKLDDQEDLKTFFMRAANFVKRFSPKKN